MIYVGSKKSGKTYHAINLILSRVSNGQSIGVISNNREHELAIMRVLKDMLKEIDVQAKISFIHLSQINDVDHVLIDNLDQVLGEKCICATGGVVHLSRDGFEKEGLGVYVNRKSEYGGKLKSKIAQALIFNRYYMSIEDKEKFKCQLFEFIDKEMFKTAIGYIDDFISDEGVELKNELKIIVRKFNERRV